MGVSYIRKTMPSPTTGTTDSVSHAPTLVRAMGQRVFENVLRGEAGTDSALTGLSAEELALMQSPSGDETMSRLRSSVHTADPGTLQAMITAAYIKASALGSGTAAWKGMAGASLRGEGLTVPGQAAVEGGVANEPPGGVSDGSGGNGLGSLAARFESGGSGIEAVGYDPGGGTSYGIYQIASKPGTMARFLDFLEAHEPQWARRLRAAGPANTGSTDGAMPRVWKSLARENPERFAQLQQAFIWETHYEPARMAIEEATGVNVGSASRAVQEVLWSSAVQHGPSRAADLFIRALKTQRAKGAAVDEAALIQSVYRDRSRFGRLFLGALGEALTRRFREEKAMALAMLAEDSRRGLA